MRYLTKRLLMVLIVGAFAALAVVLVSRWRTATLNGGQKPAEPFRIAGNLYYVGANDATSFLLTGPEGHVLIDGGYPGTAPMIMRSIARLGFNIRDVKILLNSHAHFDHAGGLAALQEASGAELWVSEGDADIIASGGDDDRAPGPMKLFAATGLIRYPAPRVDHRFKDGAKIRLGPIELTAHVTAGHTPGCTSWSFPVRDGERELLVVHVCGLTYLGFVSLARHPEVVAEFERSFKTLRSLPVDIFLASHAREFGRWRKFQARDTAANPVDPFIDRKGYLDLIDREERRFRAELAKVRR